MKVKESIPGLNEARLARAKIRAAGIEDIHLFYDKTIQPFGMWSLVQTKKDTSQILLPGSYKEGNLQPMILWLCKDAEGRFRVPNDNDVHDAIVVAKRAQTAWKKGGDWLDDQFKEQDEKKQETYKKEQRAKIHEYAPILKKAVNRELG